MAKWWKVFGGIERIEPVEVERFTADSVWIRGRRHGRITSYECFFPTWQEAHQDLLTKAECNLQNAQAHVRRAEAYLALLQSLKAPAQAEEGA